MTREAMAKVKDAEDPSELARLELRRAMEKDRRAAAEGQRDIAEKRAAAAELIVHEANNARLKELLKAARDQATANDIESARQRFAEARDDWQAAQETRDRLQKDDRRMAAAGTAEDGGWTPEFVGPEDARAHLASGRQVAIRLAGIVALVAAGAAVYFWNVASPETDAGVPPTASNAAPAQLPDNRAPAEAAASGTPSAPSSPALPVAPASPVAPVEPAVLTTGSFPAPPAGAVPVPSTDAPPSEKTAEVAPSSSIPVPDQAAPDPVATKAEAAASAIPAPPPLAEAREARTPIGPVQVPGRNPFRPDTATPPVPLTPRGGPIRLLRPDLVE